MKRLGFGVVAAASVLATFGVVGVSAQTGASAPSGLYQLRNQCNGKLLGLKYGQPSPWDDAIVVDGSPATAVWDIKPQDDGSVMLLANGSQSALQTAFARTDRSADVDLWTAWSTPTQRWKLSDAGGGYFTLQLSANPSMALDLRSGGRNGNTNVWLYDSNNTCAQRWKLEPIIGQSTTTKVVPTTAAPTTAAPTTAAPTTAAPTTITPTTAVPTTAVPTTKPAATTGNWFVATTGNDSSAGTSATPFATLTKAAQVAQPGDTIVVRSGTYNMSAAAVFENKRGTADKPITVIGEGLPILRPTDRNVVPANYTGLISVVNSSHLVVSGVRLENSGQFGFHVTKSDHITVKNSQTSGSRLSAFWADNSTDISVTGNDFSNFCDRGQFNNVGCQEGVSLETVDRFDVGYNRVHDAPQVAGIGPGGGEGIDAKFGSKNGRIHHNTVENLPQVGIYVDGWITGASNIEVDNNIVRNTYMGINVGSEKGGPVTNIRIHDNVVSNIGYDAIAVGGQVEDGPRGDISIFNNTIVANGKSANKPPFCILWSPSPCPDYGSGIRVDTKNLIGPVNIYDNIIADSATADIAVPPAVRPKVTIANNVFWSPKGNLFDNNTQGTGAINADPLFVNPAANDYTLRAGSPATGKGARR
jgi:Right handed beta helix region/Ricin-type beta-trefoil lectin domain-like